VIWAGRELVAWLWGVGCDTGGQSAGHWCNRWSRNGDGGDSYNWECDGTRSGDWVGGRAVGDGCWCRAVGSQAGQRDGGDRSRVGLGQRTWAVRHGQGGGTGDGVGLVSLHNSGWERAVGGIRADSLSCGDEDGRGGVDRWYVSGGGTEVSPDGARAVGDGKSLAGGCSVSLGALGEGGRLGAVGSKDISGDGSPHGGIVRPRQGAGDEAEDGENALHGCCCCCC